jgi:hypothetical protein
MICAKKDKRFISLKASESELDMLFFIMEKDGRNSISDCLRTLIRDRFFFLRQNILTKITDRSIDKNPKNNE